MDLHCHMRSLPKESTQEPSEVRKPFPRVRREALQHTPSAAAPQISPTITPGVLSQTSVSTLGPSHYSAFDASVSDPENAKQRLAISSVGHLTSLLLQRQDLEAQLWTLDGMIREYSPIGISTPARRDTSRQPFTERLAGILPSSMSSLGSLRDFTPSTHPSYSMPLVGFVDDAPFGVKHARKPAPLNPRSLQKEDDCAVHFPHTKGTGEVIRGCYQDTMLNLAAVDIEIELIYLSAGR